MMGYWLYYSGLYWIIGGEKRYSSAMWNTCSEK